MTDRGEKNFWMLMPPEFAYLGELFLPDLVRARLVGGIAAALPKWRASGYRVLFDPGTMGLTGAQTAEILAERGVQKVAVTGGMYDRTGVSILMDALNRKGLECGRPLLTSGNHGVVLQGLSKRLESLARMDHPYAVEAPEALQHPSPFLILEENESAPTQGVAFKKTGQGLQRVTRGGMEHLPPWVNAVRFIRPHDAPPSPSSMSQEDVLFALILPSVDEMIRPDIPSCLTLCRQVVEGVGPQRFRLILKASERLHETACGGAGWALRYGLQSPWHREFLVALTTTLLPNLFPLLNVVLGFYEVGSDPLEEMYAGCGIMERNAELIENIVP
jgi:hypothetical protein